jgi:hypothetical protein
MLPEHVEAVFRPHFVMPGVRLSLLGCLSVGLSIVEVAVCTLVFSPILRFMLVLLMCRTRYPPITGSSPHCNSFIFMT